MTGRLSRNIVIGLSRSSGREPVTPMEPWLGCITAVSARGSRALYMSWDVADPRCSTPALLSTCVSIACGILMMKVELFLSIFCGKLLK